MDFCQLCSSKTTSGNPHPYISKIPNIISNCKKYLSQDIYQLVNWNIQFHSDPFCEDCSQITVQLVQLDAQLQKIKNLTKQIVKRLSEKITNKVKQYQQPSSSNFLNFRNYDPFSIPIQTHPANNNANVQLLPDQGSTNNKNVTSDVPFQNTMDNSFDGNNSSSCIQPDNSPDTPSVTESEEPTKKRKKRSVQVTAGGNKKTTTVRTGGSTQLHNGLECNICKKKFDRPDILELHDCSSKPFKCETCTEAFVTPDELQLHRHVHNGEKFYKCDICPKIFSTMDNLQRHQLIHSIYCEAWESIHPVVSTDCQPQYHQASTNVDKSEDATTHDMTGHSIDRNTSSTIGQGQNIDGNPTIAASAKENAGDQVESAVPSSETKYGAFECKTCNRKFSRLDFLERHDCSRKTFDCEICGVSFTRQCSLKRHSILHTGEKPYKCNMCGKSFALQDSLRTHLMIHNGTKPHKCDICQQAFRAPRDLKIHERMHSDDVKVRLPYSCDICPKAFVSRRGKNEHMKSHKFNVFCTCCDKTFENDVVLKKHQQMEKRKDETKCKLCSKTFLTAEHLNLHIRRNHTEAKKFQCKTCKEKFTTKVALSIHVCKKSDNKGDLICDLCGQNSILEFRNQTQLSHHKRSYHRDAVKRDEKFTCVVCKKLYIYNKDLVEHQKKFHFVFAGRTMTCYECNREFEDFTDYHRHFKKATSGHQTLCEFCSESCPSRCNLYCHLEAKHKGADPPYKCNFCPSSFFTRTDEFRHRQLHHPSAKKPKVSQKDKIIEKENPRAKQSKILYKKDKKSETKSKKLQQLRRSPRKKTKPVDRQNLFLDFDEFEDDGSEHQFSEMNNEEVEVSIEIKTEDLDWIKQENEDEDW